MNIELRGRTEANVRLYFERTRDAEIQRMCPQRAQTVEEALADFRKMLVGETDSFGRTVYADGQYVGDIWLYCMDESTGPDAMLSFCLFDKELWGRGIMTEAARLFLEEARRKFALWTVGAFTFMENKGSVCVLEKNGFELKESFFEGGRESGYFEKDVRKAI